MSRIRRRSRRAERERRSKQSLAFAITGAVLLLALAGTLFLGGRSLHPALDTVTLCPVTQAPIEEHLILLDATDTWTELQQRVILQEVAQIQRRLPRFARVHLYTIMREETELPEPAVVLCNPGRPEDLQELPILGGMTDEVVANPTQMVKRWETGFAAPMDSVLAAYAGTPSAPQSQIMETLRGAGVQALGSPKGTSAPRYVYVFSDMLQNSPAFSHYAREPWTVDRATMLADPGELGTRALEEANVTIYLLDRPLVGAGAGHSRGALVEFWNRFLEEQGATLTRVIRIES